MVDMRWGLLGPEKLASERRTRTLGLGATVRAFNDLAVPGMGGVWFGKQLLLATLGVAVAEGVRNERKRASKNIEVANAVEAIACWLALKSNGWHRDRRLRGAAKLPRQTDFSFATVRRSRFYVTQPMRQATVQPLRELGLVESIGERFNAFRCTSIGHEFIELACGNFNPHQHRVLDHLKGWVAGDHSKISSSDSLRQALSPLESMTPGARRYLLERVVQGTGMEASRRRRALDWVESLRQKPPERMTWNEKPKMLENENDNAHWADLRAGGLFFLARDSAIALLDEIEAQIGQKSDRRFPLTTVLTKAIAEKVQKLREAAQAFLGNAHDPSPGATAFCRECTEPTDGTLLEKLISRDGRVLRLSNGTIVPGVAFRGTQDGLRTASARSPEEDGAENDVPSDIAFPDGISHRVRNLFFLNLDLRGELDDWLSDSSDTNGEA